MGKVIRLKLSVSSINAAQWELTAYRRSLNQRLDLLMQNVVDEGAKLARAKVVEMDAVMFGELFDSIEGVYHTPSGTGVIRAGAGHAAFVEFGTGVVGAENPHPQPDGWAYDTNDHGVAGWWYLGDWDGNYHWTPGMAARPFMWDTAREIPGLVAKLARGVFR